MPITLMLLAMIVMPVTYIKTGIKKNTPPFVLIARSTVYTAVGLFLIIALSDLVGSSLIDQMSKIFDQATDMLVSNKELISKLGLDKLSQDQLVKQVDTAYKMIEASTIAMLFCTAAVINFIEYNIIVKITYKGEQIPPGKKALIRELNLEPNQLAGWFIIYIVAFLISTSSPVGTIALVNINLLIESVFAIGGVSVIFYFFHLKKKPRILAILAVVALWLVPFGRDILFVGGFVDVIMGLKKRVKGI
ncbi:MAG: DUF2232 domain-containing protein [Anaerovoracaceae bacterium]